MDAVAKLQNHVLRHSIRAVPDPFPSPLKKGKSEGEGPTKQSDTKERLR